MKTDLYQVYQNLLDGTIPCESASDIMKSHDVRSTLLSYLYKDKINPLVPYTEADLQIIYNAVSILHFIFDYSGVDTGYTDSEYDILYSIMLENTGADIISVPIVPSYQISHHTYPALRGTLSKVYYLSKEEKRTNDSRSYLDDWISSMENKIKKNTGREISLQDVEVYVFPKFDGVSVVFEMNEENEIERALLRGYTKENETKEVTKHFSYLPKRTYQEYKKQKYGLKTEVMMKQSNLLYFNQKYNTEYKNTRSIVSAILNSDEYNEEKEKLLTVVPLRIGDTTGTQELAREVFEEYPYIRCKLSDREKIEKFANEHTMVKKELRTDGCVIYIIDPELQDLLGREDDKNCFEVAYKFKEEKAITSLLDMEYSVGLFGRITPIAIVEPVVLKGNTISRISLGSIERLKSLDLKYYDDVKILYDIIPYLVVDDDCLPHKGKKSVFIPRECPECGTILEETESSGLSCRNKDCPCVRKGKILNYLNKIRVKGISYAGIDILYNHGIVKRIEDLYTLHHYLSNIAALSGIGPVRLRSWIKELKEHSKIYDYELLGAIGIESISSKTFQKILTIFTIEELLTICEQDEFMKLVSIQGIKDITARKIVTGITENKDLIRYLMTTLDIVHTKGITYTPKFSVCFTKIRDPELEKYIHSLGGYTSETLTKDTSFLVVPSLSTTSSKITKAKNYNIPIVPIDDVYSYVEQYKEEK